MVLLDYFLQLAGAKPFSDFMNNGKEVKVKQSRKKTPKRRVSRRSVRTIKRTGDRRKIDRTKRKSIRERSNRRTARRTARRTVRRTARIVPTRNLSNRKFKGEPGKYSCINGCKGKSKRGYFKGTEPSPKGLGYCAHCSPLNLIMKGKDGNLWEIKKYTKGKRWVRV